MATITGACAHFETISNGTFAIDTTELGKTTTFFLLGSGNDAFIAAGNTSNVNIYSENAGGNKLDGSLAGTGTTNQLVGGAGNDTLVASTNGATDRLVGGGGADNFDFGVGAGTHTITDFTMAQGDMINLAAALVPGGQAGLGAFLTANASDNAAGVLINLGSNDTLQINGLTKADITTNSNSIFHVG